MIQNWQLDDRWKNMYIGDGTVGQYGCTISVCGNIIGVTPDVFLARMKAVNGFLGNLIIWAKIEEAFPGITIRRVWTYNNEDVKNNTPNVIVEVPAWPIKGQGMHWVQYLGNQKLYDPYTNRIRPTSDFPNPTGYCVITGKWEQKQLITYGLDDTNIASKQIVYDAWYRLSRGEYVEKKQYDTLLAEVIELRKRPTSCPPQVSRRVELELIRDTAIKALA